MYINPLISFPAGAALSVFALYGLALSSLMLASLFPPLALIPAGLFALTALSSLRGAMMTSIVEKLYNNSMDAIGHEHVHILQKDDLESGKSGFNIVANTLKTKLENALKARAPKRYYLDNMLSGNTVSYFLNDYELQARLHNLVACGYQKHGRIPMSRHELWAALIDTGVMAPQEIHEELKNSSDRSHEDFHKPGPRSSFNRAARGLADKTVAEMNTAYRAHLFDDLKNKFWRETLPYLYGHLLELYGHETGRQDMGFVSSRLPVPKTALAPARKSP